MVRLIFAFVDIMLHRRGPDILPSSPFFVWLLLAASVVVELGVLAFNGATPRALSVSVLVTFLNIWFVWGLLRTFNRERRFRQTMSALLGVEIILNVLSAPLVPLVDLPETGDPEITLPLFLTFLIGVWGLDVTAFVFARALERPYFLCVAIIVGYALLMLSLQAALLAPGA